MTREEVHSLIDNREGISVELKTCRQQVDHTVYETVCAFLNRLGGTIVMGVQDDGTIVGIEDKYVVQVQKTFVNAINNPEVLNPTTYIIPEVVEMESGKNVVVINVPESHQVHRCKGQVFDRNDEGDMDITDNSYLVGLMYMRKLGFSTERQVIPELTMDDFKEESFEKTRRRVWAGNHQHLWAEMKSEDILRTGGFWQRDPQTGREGYILAALLLWGKEQSILRYLPYFQTDALYYSWPYKRQVKPTVDVGSTFYDDRCTLRCNLIEQYTALMDFVRKNMRGKEIADAAGSGRIDLRETIFRELVANFLVHREYQAHYQGRLFIYQDRFMTENYSKMVQRGKLTIDSLVPNQKNPMLSHVFGMMNYYEGVGKGMARLREYLWRYNANACVEFENSDLFRLNVILPESEIQGPQSEAHGPQSETEGPQSRPQSEEQGPLSETTGDRMGLQDKILTLLYYEAEMSRSQLADNLGITPDTGSFRRTMKSLLEQGQIEHTDPEHPNSRFQKYRLSENARNKLKESLV